MSTIITNNMKTFITSTVSIFILFITLVFVQNNNTMIITMKSDDSPLRAQIYYTTEGRPFTEDNSRKQYKIKNNQYYFSIPKLEHIQYIRFDPAKKSANISIEKITLIRDRWFKKRIYDIPISNIIPNKQIDNFQQSDKKTTFKTTSNDPQLNIHFLYNELSVTHYVRIELLLFAILISSVLHYLYHIYKTKKLDNFLTAKLILYGLFFALALFKVDYYKDNVRFGYPPDELAHLAYIQHVHTHDDLMPNFKEMMMLNNKSAGNYLSHPPLYYKIMDMVYDKNYSIMKNVDNFRALNVIIFITSFLLILYLGFSSKISLL